MCRASDAAAGEAPPVLAVRSVGVSYGARQVLTAVDLQLAARTALALLGPGGTGKSTLLRVICGTQPRTTSIRIRGEVCFRGRSLGPDNRPLLIEQKLPLIMTSVTDFLAGGLPDRERLGRQEQTGMLRAALEAAGLEHLTAHLDARLVDLSFADRTCLAVVRAASSDPALICLDEPTAGMDDASAAQVRALITREKGRRAILLVTHHQGEAREIGDEVALLAGGRIVEHSDARSFFASPRTEAGKQFVRTGSCALPSPATPRHHLAPELRGSRKAGHPPRSFVADGRGPNGFRWLIDGRLGGAAQPGLLGDLDADLAALRRVGVSLLITLTEERTVAEADLLTSGIRSLWFPIPDMDRPDTAAAIRVCVQAEQEMRAGGAVAYHCKAGLGRTGLMLVSHLILRGVAACEALTLARQRKQQWVQSLQQEEFLWNLELFLALKLDDHGTGLRRDGSRPDRRV